ncbi:probable membrane-associated kinase regulator 6 [Juglans microcarpa x Juglans regia]|uniref:probable membrane-associated kinase regulator 6 n=1 Tax=Juglans microcarpa x Juglans regia TaxID=2249226 RepID=UPI001B7E1D12|nr:probable membrane-associated kinase regulator 6 [Juglans microcarpa x Juglans regia]
METSQPDLATESFSFSWLSNEELPDHLDDHLGCIPFRASNFDSTSHDETTSKCSFSKENSKRYSELETQNFDFNVPISQSSSSSDLVHADELFSNGIIKPVFKNPQRIRYYSSSIVSNGNNPLIPFSSASSSSRTLVPTVQVNCHFLRRWKRTLATGRILRECFGYLCRPLCRRVLRGSRKCTRVDDIDRRSLEVKSWSSSPQASPEQRFADMESSIHEAVLHCKRSCQ